MDDRLRLALEFDAGDDEDSDSSKDWDWDWDWDNSDWACLRLEGVDEEELDGMPGALVVAWLGPGSGVELDELVSLFEVELDDVDDEANRLRCEL